MQKEKLRRLRKSKGITQQQIADILHTDISNYCRKENGETRMIKEEWEKIAKFLDVSVDEIYEEDEQKIVFNAENNATGENFGNQNNYYSIPNSIIENLQDYISLLKEENQRLKKEIDNLKENKQ